ncbi:DBF4-type zinc finger-containing protein 2 [Heptranchias perlo]|uniref:DBF4-type zinc finger-containing protein 2 n=1 Tax=Heptranchias perlo TaxID=212740 RepID=UPI00355A3C2A
MDDRTGVDRPCAERPVPEAFPGQSRRGYCGCCQELYTCLEQHLQTTRHRQFASESRNQVAAKSLMERFLQDVIQYHPSRYKDNRSTYMDLPSVSAPLVPKKELADMHSYQDDKETIGTREELPSTDNESIRSAHLIGKNATSYIRAKGSVVSSVPIGDPVNRKDTIIEEPSSREQLDDINSPIRKVLRRTAFLGVSEAVLSCNKMERQGHPLSLGLYKAAPRKGIKDHNKPLAVSTHIPQRCVHHEHCSPTSAQMNFPNVSSGLAFRFSQLHNVNSQGTIAGHPLPQLRDYAAASSSRCTGGPSQTEESKPQNRNSVTCLSTLKETKIADRIEDLVSETIESVIRKYCNRHRLNPQDSDSENSAAEVKGRSTYCQLEKQRKTMEKGLQSSVPGMKRSPAGDHHPCTPTNSCEMVCSRQAIRDTTSCFKKMLSLTLSNERKSGGHHQSTGEDMCSSGGSICSLGSQLGHMKSTSSSEWDASVKVEKDCSRIAVKDLEALTDTQITLEDRGYKTQLSSVLHFQPDECDKMEEENPASSGNFAKVEHVEEKMQPLEIERKLRSLPYVPASFAGKTWSEIMAEDDLKVEALVKEFKEGRYLCYFDSESLANHGKKQKKKHRSDMKDTSKVTAESSLDVPILEAVPRLQEGNDEAEPAPALCKPVLGKKPAPRHCRLASRCQVVKVSHGTQTSDVTYPVVKKKSRRMEQEPENSWTQPEQEERSDMKTRLCSLRLPSSYSRIMSPVQPRTVIYVLSSPDFTSAAQATSREGKKNSKASEDGASPTKYKYKKSPVKYYDPVTNRILKTPPSSFSAERMSRSSHHVRQLFRSLSPDINMGRPAEERKSGAAKPRVKANGGLLHGGSVTSSTPWPGGAAKIKERALGGTPSSDCPSKSTGSSSRQTPLSRSLMGSDGPPPRRHSEHKSIVLSPLRRDTPESPFGKLNVYVGPRSRRAPEKEELLHHLRGPSSLSDSGTVAARRPRLRSGFRAAAAKDGALGGKILQKEVEGGGTAHRRRAARKRK